MYEEVKVLIHSSIKITGEKILYFDPYEIAEETHDADIIFITHDHYDHYSPEDIGKVAKEDTLIILPENMNGQTKDVVSAGGRNQFINPDESVDVNGITVKAVWAYNRLKPFHTKGKKNVGYLVTMDGITYYIAGDTDLTSEAQSVVCDVALIPVGGTYTMDYKDAAKLVNTIKPKLAIPTHYGSVVGTQQDGREFAKLVDSETEVRIMITDFS